MSFYSIYDVFEDYNFNNYDEFAKLAHDSYDKLTKRDYVINNDRCPNYELKTLCKDVLHDRFSINVDGVKFDCLMTPYDITKVNSLFVIFSGARSVKNDVLPVFKRWSYYKFIDSAVLNIADPMFNEYEDLALGWYYGSKSQSYIEYASLIVERVRSILNIERNNLYLFGSSGGGYIALQLSMYISNANHIVINPQIQINKFFYSKEFIRQTGINLSDYDPHRRNDTLNIVKDNIFSGNSKFLILQNLQAKEDCVNHLFPLLKSVGVDKLHLGLNCTNNMFVWLYTCIGGHNTQGDQVMFSHIVYLAHKLASEEPITPFDHYLIKNISVIWRQVEWLKFKNNQLSKSK